MDSPADGDEPARVVPLRRRDPELTASPVARGTLPRERAPFDPEIEPAEKPSRHVPRRGAAFRVAQSALRSRRAPQSRRKAAPTTARRVSPAFLLTGAGVAGLATVAVLALLLSLLTASTQSRATQVDSPQPISPDHVESLLSQNGGLTTSQVAEQAGASRDQVLRLLRALETAGRVRRSGQRHGTRWHAITDDDRIRQRVAELEASRKNRA